MGYEKCDGETLQRWEADHRRFPPYQYLRHHCLLHPNGALRVPSVCERKVMLGFPVQYTLKCLPKSEAKRSPASLLQTRYQLLGRASSVFALSYLVMHLMAPLGFSRYSDLQSLQQALTPGGGASLHSFLFRPPLACKPNVQRDSLAMSDLAQRLMGSVHCKGEDLLIHSSTEVGITQRLRQSISAKLWRWKTVASWKWARSGEHINKLELSALLTKFLHLTDSMVALHVVTRGRSSSHKLRNTMLHISALVLAANLRPVLAYVATDRNPADRPSRQPVKRKCVRQKSKYSA